MFGDCPSTSPSLLPGTSAVGERRPSENRHPPTPRTSVSDHLYRCKQKWVGSVNSRGHCSRTQGRGRDLITHFNARVKSLRSDKIAAVASLRNQRATHSLQLYQEVRDLLSQCHSLEITLIPFLLLERRNVGADQLSRSNQIHQTERMLSPHIFNLLCLADIFEDLTAYAYGCLDRYPEEDQQRELPSLADHSFLAEPELVPSPPQSPGGLPNSPPNEPPTTKSASTEHLPHRPTKTPATPLATIHGALINAGLSEKVASRASRGQRKSICLYESKYRVFCDWCTQ